MSPQEQEQFKTLWVRGDTIPYIMRHMRIGPGSVQHWRRKLNLPPRTEQQQSLRPPPASFVTDVEKERLSLTALRKKHNASVNTVKRWAAEAGVTIERYDPPHRRKRETPVDWHEVAPTKTAAELCEHYGMSDSLVRRLLKESGIKPLRRKIVSRRSSGPRSVIDPRPQTELDSAAHHLRRYYSVVHRCDIKLYSELDPQRKHITWGAVRGVPNDGVGWYYVDSLGIVANETVVTLAREKGWKSIYD